MGNFRACGRAVEGSEAEGGARSAVEEEAKGVPFDGQASGVGIAGALLPHIRGTSNLAEKEGRGAG